ncbi:MAG: fluoride efflux transporter CrcB [Prevotellaceae bacterium]|jgi:CrcB protein|nr:fluoride efflux transporter CrcB [Prevotellaceae bacterium]
MKTIFLIALGGAAGSVLRYLTTRFVTNRIDCANPIYGTFTANFAGCLAIGIIFGLAERYSWFSTSLRQLLVVGFCGGYTTFSAFALENLNLLRTGNYAAAFLSISASVVLCIAATFVGIAIVNVVS